MSYLLDTNVISELRKGSRCNANVAAWHESLDTGSLWLSVLVIGEIRQGIEFLQRKDPVSASHLDKWLNGLEKRFADRILPVTLGIAHRWGILNAHLPTAYIDGFLAATALEHNLVLVTRNTPDIQNTGVSFINPFEAQDQQIS